MKKHFLIILISFLFSTFLFSEDIFISKISAFNSNGENIVLINRPESIISKKTNDFWFNSLIDFKLAPQNKTGTITSTYEAIRACNLLKCNFIIYGYVRKENNSWYGELKLFNAETKKVQQQFFASDDINNYERMVEDLASKISLYFIADLKIPDKDDNKNIRNFECRMPFSLNFWMPLEEKWFDSLIGISGFNFGIELFPEMRRKIYKKQIYDYSIRPELSYSIGIGNPNKYSLIYNSFDFSLPIILNLYHNQSHFFKIGIGPVYELNLLQFSPKYDDQIFVTQNQGGLVLLFGYEYKLNDNWKFSTELDTKVYVIADTLISTNLRIGVSKTLYIKESRKSK